MRKAPKDTIMVWPLGFDERSSKIRIDIFNVKQMGYTLSSRNLQETNAKTLNLIHETVTGSN